MRREQILNKLGSDARRIFESAKRLAVLKGGVLTAAHLGVALLEAAPTPRSDGACEALLARLKRAVDALPSGAAERVVISREAQALLAESIRIAELESGGPVEPPHLLRALLQSEQRPRGSLADLDANESGIADGLSDGSGSPGGRRERAEALKRFCTDLVEVSRSSSDHPFVGREREIAAILETLCRKLKNNPLLIGRPGVGKTALVNAIAKRLDEGPVPARLKGKRVFEVSRIKLLADTRYSGEIEERLKRLLAAVREEGDVILFFDEVHSLVGAGGPATGDVANLLKSSLSRGEITCIGATTLDEYYKYIAADEALARRFSTITIEEPSADETVRILSRSRESFERHHGIEIKQQTIRLIVELAGRYLHSRSFPDKAFDLMDRAAAKATLGGAPGLAQESVVETLSEITGLPLEIMDEAPQRRLGRLENYLNTAVPGQETAARDVARVVRIAKLELELRPERPDGVFLFVGPQGVGKSEMAEALAVFLYGSTRKLIEFDMSQFTAQWAMSRLIGAEPGYVGYGDRSGQLSKSVEENPHSVLYFKNIDLAHPIVQEFLGEAFDAGRFTDARGSRISLSNTTVVMSLSRVAAARPAPIGFSGRMTARAKREAQPNLLSLARETGLRESLAAAIDEVIEFCVLDRSAVERIVTDQILALIRRVETVKQISIEVRDEAVQMFTDRLISENQSTARLARLLQASIVEPLTRDDTGLEPGTRIVITAVGDRLTLEAMPLEE